jgi:hypothetical protein
MSGFESHQKCPDPNHQLLTEQYLYLRSFNVIFFASIANFPIAFSYCKPTVYSSVQNLKNKFLNFHNLITFPPLGGQHFSFSFFPKKVFYNFIPLSLIIIFMQYQHAFHCFIGAIIFTCCVAVQEKMV